MHHCIRFTCMLWLNVCLCVYFQPFPLCSLACQLFHFQHVYSINLFDLIFFSRYFQQSVNNRFNTTEYPYSFERFIVNTLNAICHDEISISTWPADKHMSHAHAHAHTHIYI